MKQIVKFLGIIFIGLIVFASASLAQDQPVPTDQFLLYLFTSIGGFKGAGALVIAYGVSQIIVMALKTQLFSGIFSSWSGLGKLIVISLITISSGVLGLMVSGVSFGAALTHSSTLAAISVFINQYVQQAKKI